uniref:Calcium voltage-gated channel auxiliary subunit alpha2delta 1 n=1 Tax=Sparus aurata TaxID=8175 RepID=A0A671YBP8_SPAAU
MLQQKKNKEALYDVINLPVSILVCILIFFFFPPQLDANETEGRKYRIRPDFKEDPSFKRLTDHNHTAVHIPTDIYDGSTIVLNELNWTEALEEVFKKNREDDPTLLWQVFGSATGLARYYPASPWMDARKTPSKIDLYDVRRRPWYIQGAASPKDMLILVDASGSVSGLTLKLIRTSVSEMLETLSDDDYVNVVYFNTRVKETACFNHLVQANVRNKKLLKDAVQNITAKGITNYTKGFEFAFRQLSATNVSRANCNKIIMLFTDGGEERAQAILQKYNADKKVRIFTFSVGQHNYDKGPIQWMACSNKGYFYEIPSIGAIRINTQEYLDVLGRPMVLADKQAKQVQWTNVYLDALELGLVITGTLPVFNKTKTKDDRNGEHQNQLILGVMGIDVSLDDIKKLTPRFTIGPNGYYFAIDPNGYVLLHPNLQPKCSYSGVAARTEISSFSPQNPKFQEPVTLDFLDAELENDIKVEVKCADTWKSRYIDRGIRTYTWAPVNGTDYSDPDTMLQHGCHNTGRKQVSGIETDRYSFFREYCKELKLSPNNTEFLLDFSQYIDRNTPNACESRFFSSLLLICAGSDVSLDGIVARFVATDGGITRIYPRSAGEEWTENPETYESSFYKRTLDNEIYIFTAPSFNSKEPVSESGILVSKAVDLTIGEVTLKPLMYDFNKKSSFSFIASVLRPTLQQVDCVILDDGGFLLMSNQDEYINLIGQFFGEVDPVLMINLVNTSLYAFNKTYDYQSVCDPERDSKAAAGPNPSLCITEQTQYFFDIEERSYSGNLDCGNCSRMYRAEKLPNTNLVFLITDAKATCLSCDPRPLRQAEQPSEGPDPCELAQNPRYRKGPDVCFDNNENVRRSHTCAEIIAGSSSISQTSQLASVYFCLVSISAHTAGCLLLHSDPYLIYSFTSFFTYRFVIVFISLPLHALITQSFFAFLLPPVVSPLIIRHSCGSASPPAAALIGQDEPLCPISRGSPLSPAPLLLLLMLCSGSVSSHGSTQLHY